jgi:membrane-associated phospholipid phosphatase
MSDALLTTRDAITGYWDGKQSIVPKSNKGKTALETAINKKIELPAPGAGMGADPYLGKIKMQAQAAILDTLLTSTPKFNPITNGCDITVGKHMLISLTRPRTQVFMDQLDWVRAYTDLRADRISEIFLQLDDMASFFGAQAYLDSGRRKYTLMMMDIARSFATHLEIPLKYYCRAPRPIDFAMEVQPVIQTPDHSSFPSGHATEAFAMATVLYRLSTGKSAGDGVDEMALPFRLAHRIAANRTVAGVHFPVDSRAGAFVGCAAGELIYAVATGKKATTVSYHHGDTSADFLLSNFDLKAQSTEVNIGQQNQVAANLWKKATAEW